MQEQEQNPYRAPAPPAGVPRGRPRLAWWQWACMGICSSTLLAMLGALTYILVVRPASLSPFTILILAGSSVPLLVTLSVSWRAWVYWYTTSWPRLGATWLQLGLLFAVALLGRFGLPPLFAWIFSGAPDDVNWLPMWPLAQVLTMQCTGLLLAIPLLIVPMHLFSRWRAGRASVGSS